LDQTAASSSVKISGEAKVQGPESKLVGSRNKLLERKGGQKPAQKKSSIFQIAAESCKSFFSMCG